MSDAPHGDVKWKGLDGKYYSADQIPPSTIKRAPNWVLFTVGGLMALVLALAIAAAALAPDDTGSSAGAESVCEQFIDQRLKAPATSEYGFTSTVRKGMTHWVARGHVDSQNGFGALVRSDFTCQVRHLSDDTWRLVDLEVD